METKNKYRVWFGEAYVINAKTKKEAIEKGEIMFEKSNSIECDAELIKH